jgi:hypothetical protein
MDLGHRLAIALQDDHLPLLFDRLDQLGQSALGFMHIDGDHD